MRQLLCIVLLLISLHNCNSDSRADEGDSLQHFYLNYEIECCTRLYLTETPVRYSYSSSDSLYALNYAFLGGSFAPDSVTYLLKENESFEPEYLVNGEKTDDGFFLVSARSFTTDRDYQVFKLAGSPAVIDGCVTHFWVPEFGIILVRSVTWGNFRKLRTNNDSINRQIDLLAELIYQDTGFYTGCMGEMELIPKKDADEFYAWKLRKLDISLD